MRVPSPCPDLDQLVVADGSPVPVEHHVVHRPWGQQHVVEAGPREAPAVLLVHGWPEHWLAWRHVIADLARDHHVLAVDTRGFGWSTGSPGRADIGRLADDLVAALDAFAVAEVVLAAHDWGGWIAFRWDPLESTCRHASLSIL